jgi:hypothetical protein
MAGIAPVSNNVIDSSDANFILPNEAIVCYADEVWTNGLASVEITNEPMALSKMPVLFVPGLLGSEILKNNEKLWPNALQMMVDPFDGFMNDLAFDVNLKSLNNIFKGLIIRKETDLFDYSDGLIKEFQAQGYNADEGSAGQTFFTFPYDWRYGVSGKYPDGKTNGDLLKEKINQILAQTGASKVDVIAHSMGGLIVKKYVMDRIENGGAPNIDKLVFVGVPNFGSPDAAKTLLLGNDFRVTGLSAAEIKKISRNMPAAYDLLPTKGYFAKRDGYLQTRTYNPSKLGDLQNLGYGESMVHIANFGANEKGVLSANVLHSDEFDFFDTRTAGIKTYNIIGCKSGTFHGLIDSQDNNGMYGNYLSDERYVSGDDAVPFESADSVIADENKTFYMPLANHGQMPSQDGVRQMIISIIAGGPVPAQIIPFSSLKNDPTLCQIRGDVIAIHSPLDIFVTETDSGKNLRLGLDENGNIVREIPGASFEIINERKYLFLPQGDGQIYSINLQGTGSGTFTLIKEKIEGDNVVSADVFADVPVTNDFSGSLEIEGNAQIIKTDGARIDSVEIPVSAVGDAVAPQTAVSINGQMPKGFYNASTTIILSAIDLAQTGTDSAGVLLINYRLDGATATTTMGATTTIAVSGQGKHILGYRAKDKLGNEEEEKSIEFVIDKIAPEIKFQFDQTKKDLAFSAADDYSASSSIGIVDKSGTVSAIDQAGNETKLSFFQKDRKQSLRAQLTGLSYNGQTINLSGNQLAFAWFYGYTPKLPPLLTGLQSLPAIPAKLSKTGPLSFLLQQVKLKDGSFAVALFGNNKTLLLEYKNKKLNFKTFRGLKLLNFATDKGKLGWSY